MNTKHSYTVPGTGKHWGYLQALPADYAETDKDYPLVIFLHGSGECGNGTTELHRVAIHGYPRYADEGREYPCILISPQLPEGKYWGAYIESLNLFLDHLIHTLRVDTSRIYLTGLSNGGTGTWLWGQANADRFAALIPVCGAGICWGVRELLNVPVWAFHGDCDEAIDYHETVRMVEGINNMGGNAKMTVYPGAGHGCWIYTYVDEELMNWMLDQHRD